MIMIKIIIYSLISWGPIRWWYFYIYHYISNMYNDTDGNSSDYAAYVNNEKWYESNVTKNNVTKNKVMLQGISTNVVRDIY